MADLQSTPRRRRPSTVLLTPPPLDDIRALHQEGGEHPNRRCLAQQGQRRREKNMRLSAQRQALQPLTNFAISDAREVEQRQPETVLGKCGKFYERIIDLTIV